MAILKPFVALRPQAQYVEKVASLPYDVMSVEEAKEIVKDRPYSFLQIDLPEVFLKSDEKQDNPIKYEYAKEYLQKLIHENILERDKDESYYIYQLQNKTVTQRGIVGLASSHEYNEGIIKKHENTRADKEHDRINHVDACNAHTGPIFLAYSKNSVLKSIIEGYIKAHTPLYHFTADDGVVHTIWKVTQNVGVEITQAFNKIDNLYIADGHHRAAAAAAVAAQRQTPKSQYFLSVAFDEEELCIMDYNRVVKDLNGLSVQAFIEKISESFILEEVGHIHKPSARHTFGMYCNKKWYSLFAKEHIISQDIVKSLDVSILQDYILDPVLGIKEPRTDNRIEFIGGIRGLSYLEEIADEYSGIAFSMFPTAIQELMAVADIGELMPPKSTWFEPKLRSGIFINELEKEDK